MKLKKILVIMLLFALVISSEIPIVSFAESENSVKAWISNEKNGSYCSYVHPGETVYLNYVYTGNWKQYDIAVSFTKDGKTLIYDEYNNSNALNLSYVPDEGEYVLTITITKDAESISDSFLLTVSPDFPHIKTQPKDVSYKTDQPVTYTVEAEESDCSYQWYQADYLSEPGIAISGAINSQLTVSPKSISTTKYYYCVLSKNGKEVISRYALLQKADSNNSSTTPIVSTPPNTTATPSNSGSSVKTTVYKKNMKIKAVYKPGIGTKLSWTPINNLSKVKVYRGTSKSKLKEIGSTVNNFYFDKKTVNNKKYYYKVVCKTAGSMLYYEYTSNICQIMAKFNPNISKFVLKKAKKKVSLKWTFANTGKKVIIYYKTNKKFKKIGVVSGSKTPCRLNISGVKKITIRIRAYNVIKGKKYYSNKKTKTIKM